MRHVGLRCTVIVVVNRSAGVGLTGRPYPSSYVDQICVVLPLLHARVLRVRFVACVCAVTVNYTPEWSTIDELGCQDGDGQSAMSSSVNYIRVVTMFLTPMQILGSEECDSWPIQPITDCADITVVDRRRVVAA